MTDATPQSQLGAKVRKIVHDDLPWVADVCAHAYPGRVKDWDGFYAWWKQAVSNPNLLCIRTDIAFLVSALHRFFYDPSLVLGTAVYFASEQTAPWDMVALVRTGARWAVDAGALEYEVDATTGIDPKPLAARIGNLTERSVYRIGLNHVRQQHS